LGIAPLQFAPGESAESLGPDGTGVYDIRGLAAITNGPLPETSTVEARQSDGATITVQARLRIDTPVEAEYFRHQGLLRFLAGRMAAASWDHVLHVCWSTEAHRVTGPDTLWGRRGRAPDTPGAITGHPGDTNCLSPQERNSS